MSRIYTSSNKIKFTSISERYKTSKSCKGKISELHSELITYVVHNFKNTKRYKQQVVNVLNIMTYVVYTGEILPFNWKISKPFENIPDFDFDLIESTLGDIFLTVDSIEWDVTPIQSDSINTSKKSIESVTSVNFSNDVKSVKTFQPTPKQDLYIQSPVVPRFDFNKPWLQGHEGSDDLVIYTTLPEIPTRQNEISCTTDVTKMTYSELMNLYPNTTIHTRAPVLYKHIEGLDYEEGLGVILPIDGYTREQLIDNIIQYPHFYKLVREVDGNLCSFYTHIEIDGELYSILDIWNTLPDTYKIPRQKEFVKEYVVRKYLLDRTWKHVEYKYPLYGSLDPYLTLFMPANDYMNKGYTDLENIAKQCVISRVKYKLSRNPIVRRLDDNAKLHI